MPHIVEVRYNYENWEEWRTYLKPTTIYALYLTRQFQMILIIIILMFLEKRKKLSLGCFKGHFALIVPVNLLEGRNRRRPILACFAMITIEVCEILNNKQNIQDIDSQFARQFVAVYAKLCSVTFISLNFLPILHCINAPSLPNSVIGITYTSVYVIARVLEKIPHPTLPLAILMDKLFVQAIIFAISGPYIVYWFVKQIVRSRNYSWDNDHTMPHSQTKYVRNLLLSHDKYIAQNTSIHAESFPTVVKQWFGQYIYCSIPGFKYSLTILVSCTVGFLAVTKVATVLMFTTINMFLSFRVFLVAQADLKEESIPNFIKTIVTLLASNDNGADVASEITLYDFIRSQLNVSLIALLLGILSAYLVHGLTICHMLMSYRRNVLNVYRRQKQKEIVDIKSISNVSLVMAAIQFAGFQVAHFLWGFLIQVTTFGVGYLFVGELLVLPLVYAFGVFCRWLLELTTPLIIVIILTKGTLHILVKYAFLEDRGNTMALNNRKAFFITMYTVFFYNVFTGLFSCILRILKGTIIGIFLVPRLDKSVFPRMLESQDFGFKSYSCLLYLEALQTNPIVKCFVDLLLQKRPLSDSKEKINMFCLNSNSNLLKVKRRANIRARNRWFIALTLINNPSIIGARGVQLVLGIHHDHTKHNKLAEINELKTETEI